MIYGYLKMAKAFRVAIMGNQGGIGTLDYFSYGLQVFDLCADQICRLIETPNMDKVTDIGAVPSMQYSVMTGGRSYPLVSREEVAQVMRGVEILVVVMSTRPYYMTSLSQEFFNYIFMENLSETCQHVVIRITKDEDTNTGAGDNKQSRSRRNWRLRSEGKVDPDKVMKMYGFEKEKIMAKVSIIADGVKLSKKSKKSQTTEDPIQIMIAQLHSELTRKEFKSAFTQPAKETFTAGKSLLGLGQRFSNWLGSLIKSQ